MKKSLAALAAVVALAGSVAAVPAHAQGYYYAPGYYYGPGYYAPPQSYRYNGAPAYASDPLGPCYLQRQRIWDGLGWRVRTVRVCG